MPEPLSDQATEDKADTVDAVRAMTQILDTPPPVALEILGGETRLAGKWTHGELHAALPALNTHVVMTYYGTVAPEIVWRSGGRRLVSRTRPGTLTLIPDGHDGRWDIAGELEVSHVYLSDARLQAVAAPLTDGKPVELLGRLAFDDPAAGRVLELLGREAAIGDTSSRLFVEQALDLLCIQLVRGHSSFGVLPVEPPRRGLADWQVKKVVGYMRDHLDEEIGLDELAKLVHLSRFHFVTSFRQATGRTPHEWLVGERMARARTLLSDPMLPITEVALLVGFQTPSSFTAAFRKALGVTPSEFRRRL